MKRLAALLLAPALACAAPTEILPLSGMGAADEAPVYWDFKLDAGRGAGEWKRILVPSCWEQQGFGAYYYGTQGRGKPDDDPVIPKETGTYRRTFELPESWSDRQVHVVFEAAMTDTTVFVNGRQAGDTHQGGFYRFDYDITRLVIAGRNEIEVRVAKESANTSVNRAERRGDYWTFGGIYRPVWIEARPRHHIAWTAIDARADGSFSAALHLGGDAPHGARVRAQFIDAAGKTVGEAAAAVSGDSGSIVSKLRAPKLWSAETPTLYTVKFTLLRGKQSLHELTQRFGFRTLEVRPRDGVYLNGHKIVLKGVNRHSFNADTGRTLTRAQNFDDARLIKGANMNAVRMSHYPPDPAFLEAADELGLYVLDELAGWQGSYDTPTGARLIGQMIRRDVNHPSILFWDNGNEGGWNTDNDGEFARWDPQRRPVLHPWAIHDGINTDHYENYDSTVRLSAGPEIFMPTEFLHGLYDGGIGAGMHDYWEVMGKSPTVAGGFFWAFADEGIARSDRGGKLDNVGNSAPDGMLGARHEKEGSYFTVKQIWSPVQLRDIRFNAGLVTLRVENHYDFLALNCCTLRWRHLGTDVTGATAVAASGVTPLPSIAARDSTDWSLRLPFDDLPSDDIIELTVLDAQQQELWTWTLAGEPGLLTMTSVGRTEARAEGHVVFAGDYALEFDPASGAVVHISRGGLRLPISGPWLVAWQRETPQRTFKPAAPAPRLRKLELAPGGGVLARAEYDGALHKVTWGLVDGRLTLTYDIDYRGGADILGVNFDYPESQVLAKRWLGAGPYHAWKNRQEGSWLGVHAAPYSRAVPGETYAYPEFQGFFGAWRWLEVQTSDATVRVGNGNAAIPFFALYSPAGGEKPVIELPPLGWSFLHAIPPIGTKFTPPDVLGPQSQSTEIGKSVGGVLTIELLPR
jgi:glycosyl hydrolase family 2